MTSVRRKEGRVPLNMRAAIRYLIDVKDYLQAAAAAAGLTTAELRRSLGQPEVRRFALAERQLAIEAFCLGSPSALSRVRDQSENGMAVVAAVKAGEMLKIGAIEAEAASTKRAPGLSIVILQPATGERQVAHTPPQQLIDITSVPAAVSTDAEAQAQ